MNRDILHVDKAKFDQVNNVNVGGVDQQIKELNVNVVQHRYLYVRWIEYP